MYQKDKEFNEDLTHPLLLLLLPQNWTKLQFLIQKTGTGLFVL